LLIKCFDCTIFEADDGRKGLEIVLKENPDLVLLDLAMPEIDGLKVLKTIRSIPQIEKTPVIVTSAFAKEDLIKNTLEMGIENYLLKPFDSATVLERIGETLIKIGCAKKIEYNLYENLSEE
jgi:YesN/AraC family two-component response regulator